MIFANQATLFQRPFRKDPPILSTRRRPTQSVVYSFYSIVVKTEEPYTPSRPSGEILVPSKYVKSTNSAGVLQPAGWCTGFENKGILKV